MRQLVSIQKIDNVSPIDGADAIEKVKILGWNCVAKKGEFKIGDPCAYFEIDSIVPDVPEFEFLRQNKFRIRTIKLRGQVSQGLALPLDIVRSIIEKSGKPIPQMNIGDDITDDLGVTKWEPQSQGMGNMKQAGNFPHFIRKTDETRVQSVPDVISEFKNEEIVATVKCDGTSATFFVFEGRFGVCSRNFEIKDPSDENTSNVYWDIAKKYNLKSNMISKNKNFAIQGEIVGPGIQKNRMGLKEVELRVFNVWFIDHYRYANHDEMIDICNDLDLIPVDIVYKGPFTFDSVESLLELSEGNYVNTNHPREGIVIRPIVERESKALKGRASFKVINNNFLLKTKE